MSSKVLVIDDDRIVVFLCRSMLEKFGIAGSFSSAQNGQVALALLKEQLANDPDNLPDLILLDLNMPVMNGWEFLEEYRRLKTRIKKQVALMVLSSSIDPEDINKANHHDLVDAYLHKPLERETIDFIQKFMSGEAERDPGGAHL